MANVYARQQTGYGGSFASDIAALTIAGNPNSQLGIVQNVQISFAQQIARIYDVSNGGVSTGAGPSLGIGGGIVPVFYVGGRTQGQATIARVLGPQSSALCDFYTAMGNVCNPQDLSFTFRGGCTPSGGPGSTAVKAVIGNAKGTAPFNKVMYTIQAAVMTNMGVQVGSQDMIVNENVTLMFANLDCQEV